MEGITRGTRAPQGYKSTKGEEYQSDSFIVVVQANVVRKERHIYHSIYKSQLTIPTASTRSEKTSE